MIEEIVKDLLDYQPEKIILFGSVARGEADEYSDIDLVLIKKTYQRFIQRLIEASQYLKIAKSVDIFVYTPEEIEQMREEGNPFIQRVLKEGKVIYERTS